MSKIKEILNDLAGKLFLRGFINAIRVFKILEIDYGHFISAQKWQSIDRNNKPIPWLTYPAIDYLNTLDLSKKSILEWGSGYSTLYWSKKAQEILSIEHNPRFFDFIAKKTKALKNVRLYLAKNKGEYISAIKSARKKFDIIVIDGVYRNDCLSISDNFLERNGFIIFDNAERKEHSWFIKKFCKNNNYLQVTFKGFSPINPYVSETALIFKR